MRRTLALVASCVLLALFALESPAPAGRIIATFELPDNPTGKHFTDNGTWVEITPVPGPQGPQGIQGIQGPAGADGAQGLPGTNGAPGADGAAGAQGVQGVQGPQGIQGPAGPASPLCVPFVSGTVTLTNQAVADTELPATQWRVKVDLAGYTEFRVVARVATVGVSGADLRLQGSTDDSAFANLDGSAGPEIDLTAAGEKDSGWVSLSATYRANNVRIRMIGKQGNATADPVVRQMIVYFR